MVYLYKTKKAQSQVVTAVLLILIVIALAVIILNFSTNFVEESLDGTGCFELVQKEGVRFVDSNSHTCMDGTSNELRLQVQLGDINQSIKGFLIELGGASSRSIEITEGVTFSDVRMSDGVYGDALSLPPSRNSGRTYVLDTGAPEFVKLYPILLNNDVCDTVDTINSISICR